MDKPEMKYFVLRLDHNIEWRKLWEKITHFKDVSNLTGEKLANMIIECLQQPYLQHKYLLPSNKVIEEEISN